MNCREAEHFVFVERDRALDDTQRAQLASHLATCAACRRMQSDLNRAVTQWRETESAVRIPDPDIEWHKLARALRPEAQASRRYRPIWLTLPAAIAAVAALGLYYLTPGSGPEHLNSAAPRVAARQPVTDATAGAQSSTVVYVDEKSGWTFVWAPDNGANNHNI